LLLIVLFASLAGPAFAAMKYFPERKDTCLACHGENGVSPTPETPSLGGVPEFYALLQLVAFREHNRKSDIMREIVKDMTDDDLRAAAAFVATQPRPAPPEDAGDPERMQRGEALAVKNHCNQCHGKQYLGGEQMPPLRNQREDYLLKALGDFKAERRVGDRADMIEVLTPLGEKDFGNLAYFLARVRD
jgi:cytochrome c553